MDNIYISIDNARESGIGNLKTALQDFVDMFEDKEFAKKVLERNGVKFS